MKPISPKYRMNACLISYSFYEMDFRVRRYAEALAEKGYDVDVITLRKNNQRKKETLNKVNLFRIQKRDFKEKNIISFMINQLIFFILGSMLLSVRHITRRYSIVHIHNIPDFLIFMGLIPKLSRAKLILDIHDVVPEYYCQKYGKSFDSFMSKLFLFIEKRSVRFADHVIVANDIWRTKLIERNSLPLHKCTTILNYPQLRYFSISRDKCHNHGFTLIYPGTISKQHGLDVAIKAVALLKERITQLRLNIYALGGNLFLKDDLNSLVKSLGLENTVVFLDPLPTEAMGKIMSEADIGIVPKRGGIFSDEAFSTKILEFMAAGLPVVASRTRIDEYYFDDSMIKFFEEGNPQDMARCIYELYEQPDIRDYLTNNANKFIKENNWALKEKTYLKIVNDLLYSEKS